MAGWANPKKWWAPSVPRIGRLQLRDRQVITIDAANDIGRKPQKSLDLTFSKGKSYSAFGKGGWEDFWEHLSTDELMDFKETEICSIFQNFL